MNRHNPMLARASMITAALLLSACAAAMPGYSPPPFKSQGKFTTAAESGTIDSSGHYQLSEQEKAIDCKRVTGSMQIIIARLRDAAGRSGSTGLSSAAHQTLAPVTSGSTRAADRDSVIARERARLDGYNRQLAAKGCKTLNIEAELARPADPPGKRY